MMPKQSPRRPDVPISGLLDLEAEVDVVKGDFQIFGVIAADPKEKLLTKDEAGRGHRGDVRRQGQAAEVSRIVPARVSMQMVGARADSDEHTTVLEFAVRIQELGADGAVGRQDRQSRHFLQPSRLDHLDVVVEETEQISFAAATALLFMSE